MSWARPGLAAGLVGFAVLSAAGCTQDFGQFEPGDAAGPSSSGGPGPASGSGAEGGGGPSSSSSASAGGSGAAGGGGTAGSGGAPGPEDCLNGSDDDGDGDVDCADSECAPGHQCLPEPPVGWEGYARAEVAAFSDPAPPPCPGGGDPESFYGDPAPATCTACACDPPDAECAPPPVSVWLGSATCTGTFIDFTDSVDAGQCYEPILSSSTPRSVALTGVATLADPGSCATSGGALTATDPWETRVAVCEIAGPFGGGCAAGVCAPVGSGDYDGPACIARDGEEPCPAGWPAQTIVYADFTDDRQCGACACGAASGTTCSGGSYTIYDFDGCAGGNTVVVDSTSCVNVSDQWEMSTGSAELTPPVAAGGACQASAGAPTGGVTGLGPRTICCQ